MPDVKPLKYKELKGFLTDKQLSEHHDVLYAGYCKNLDKIRDAVKKVDLENVNATFSDLRELKIEETFAANGVRLHEYYFDNMVQGGKPATGKIADLLKRDFGSVEAWDKQFRACGLAARGWVVLAYDLEDGKLHNYIADAHNQGGIWNAIALLILDVYEHAYFVDYATGRKKYIEGFMQNVDWDAVNKRLEKWIK